MRPIDADALVIKLPDDLPYKASVKRVLLQAPTLDVVPREEVAKIFAEIEKIFCQHRVDGYYLNGVWFPERLDLYTGDAIAELKKKYTGGAHG